MLERGQVTIFVIIGIVVLSISITSFYLFQRAQETQRESELSGLTQLPPELQEEKENVENCLADILQEGTLLIGKNGGYIFEKPKKTVNYFDNDVAYIESISRETILEELSNYLIKESGKCSNNEDIEEVDVNIKEDLIESEVEMPVTLEKDGTSAKLRFFKTEFNTKLGNMLSVIEKVKLDPSCMSCLMDNVAKENMKATIDVFDDHKVYRIEDEDYAIDFAVD